MKLVLKRLAYAIIGIFALFYFVLSMGLTLAGRLPENSSGAEGVEGRSKEPHSVTLIDQGYESLRRRLQMIESAKRSIDLEFFIYNIDQASRLLTQALAAKAREGVKVRILVDFSTPIFQLKPAYAHFLKQHGIEVRYYNTSALYRIVSAQHRSHRKLFIVDNEAMITGGRNIADEYFDLGPHYNFLDSDLEIRGPIVQTATKSFELYWNYTLSAPSTAATEGLDEAAKFLEPTPVDLEMRKQALMVPPRAPPPVHSCNDIEYVSDLPGRSERSRRVFAAIARVLNEAEREVLAESPYFVMREGGMEVLRELTGRKVGLSVLTNGLASTDASYVVSSLFLGRRKLAESGMKLWVYNGDPLGGGQGRWGIHAKRAVVDGSTVMIGTYNIDPRSANLNSEVMVVCRGSRALAAQMTEDIDRRVKQSLLVMDKGELISARNITSGASFGQKIMFIVMLPVAHLFDFIL